MVAAPNIAAVRNCLLRIGYDNSWCHESLTLSNGKAVPLVAFSGQPFDARTACVSAIAGNSHNNDAVAALRSVAAPVTIVAGSETYEVWRQGEAQPFQLDVLESGQLDNYFDRNRDSLNPSALYRAKVWGRFEGRQLAFVDVGLLPLLESEAGERITALIVGVVRDVQHSLGWKSPTTEQGQWLLKSVFWLLAAKILQDKHVERFVRMDVQDIDTVFERVAQHYRAPQNNGGRLGKRRREVLAHAALRIKMFSSLRLLSTESLGYVYESALVDRAARQSLGTHSTPAWLVDYMIGRLRSRIEAMPVEGRRVFEPACGHAGFLIGGLRLLSELRPHDHYEDRKSYLRKRLRGVEIDVFAIEIARLSLTLADVPNPNGWALTHADMFEGGTLAEESAAASIVLSNPPFERFDVSSRENDWQYNKASETFRRVVEHLPLGGVLGFIVPHNFLVSSQDSELRRMFSSQYEIAEISVFADRVFRCGAPESAILIAQRCRNADSARVLYQRVRETEIDQFKHTYQPSSTELLSQATLTAGKDASFFVPELSALWESLQRLPRLAESVEIGKGLEHKSSHSLPKGVVTMSEVLRRGLVAGFSGWTAGVMLHGLPREVWLNIDESVVRRPLSGTTVGRAQVVVNYARVSRGPWCLKALIDERGHAATSRFLIVRPREGTMSLQVLWALLNSPLGNAYMHTHSTKRDMLGGTLEDLPVPILGADAHAALEQAVNRYLLAARTYVTGADAQADLFSQRSTDGTSSETLRNLLWQIDAQVLQLYELPPELEQRLLHLFAGAERGGVPFEQHEYFPKRFTLLSRLSDLLRILTSWDAISEHKEHLVDQKLQRKASPDELRELRELQRLTSARRELYAPLPLEAVEQVKADLVRRGIWKD